jgi:hypothetical protein
MSPRSPTILLGGAAILATYGVVMLVEPSVLRSLVGLDFTSVNAPTEIRAFYGGLELGIAVFLFVCGRNPPLVPVGLLFCALAFSFAGGARLLGVLQYGAEGVSQPVVGVVEMTFAALCAWARVPSKSGVGES